MRSLAFACPLVAGLVGLAVLAGLAGPAAADDPPLETHKGQFGLSLRTGIGVAAVLPYASTVYCGASDSTTTSGNAAVCAERAPFAIDFEASYGVATSIELTLGFTLGLEHDFGATADMAGPVPIRLSPGARFFFSESGRSKLFVQPELVFDFSSYKDPSGTSRGTDVGARAREGYWFDFHHNVGGYVFISETIGVVRWLSGDFEAGIGIQARYP